MDKTTNFDVLITYSERMAQSANSLSEGSDKPFTKASGNESYNLVYGYFLQICRKNNLKAAFTTSADIVGAGKCRGYWLYEDGNWIKVRKTCYSELIFDKFSPTNINIKNRRELLFSSRKVKPFNDPYLFELFLDKQKTYDKFKKYSIPTVTIDGHSKKAIENAICILKNKIAKHTQNTDFSNEVIMKNRFGAGGRNVYKYKLSQISDMVATTINRKNITFILQPFVKFNKGFSVYGPPASTDIRLIYFGKRVIQTYTRTAKKGDFKCNEHAGGLLKYVNKNKIPAMVTALSGKLAKSLNKKSSLFALDFIISNSGNIYLLEANTGPGLDWNLSIKENELEAKKLIRLIVREIGKRIELKKKTSRKTSKTPVSTPLISGYLNA